jgi:hypothetical protein
MNIWKVELKHQDIKNFSTEDDIKKHVHSKMVDDNPMLNFDEFYDNKDKKPREGYLHIFIVPIITGKCTLIFYLSNKKFAVLLIISLFLCFHFPHPPTKSTCRKKDVFGMKVLGKQMLFRVMRFDEFLYHKWNSNQYARIIIYTWTKLLGWLSLI